MNGRKLKGCLGKAAMMIFDNSSDQREKRTASLEQLARETIGDSYIEEDPSVAEWFHGLVPSSQGVAEYVRELFPSARWMRRYNVPWLIGDAIAGRLLLGMRLTNMY